MFNLRIQSNIMLLVLATCFTSFLISHQTTAQENPEFTVSVQDVLEIRVGSWDITRKAYDEWQGLSGKYTVGMDGKISYPYVGSVAVKGKRLEDISRTIAKNLKIAIGLPNLPAVAIEIASYNPIFVTGDVYRPGQYDFRPGITVRQAMAMAGGVGRAGSSSSDIQRDILKALGQRRLLIQNQQRLLLRIARLEAENKDGQEFVTPQEIQSRLFDSGLIEIEKNIFINNTEALKQQILSVDELIELLAIVIEKLENQLSLNRAEISRSETDLVKKKKLLQSGTIRANDVAALARTITELRLRDIELTVEKLRAEQSLNQAQREKIDIRKENRSRLLGQLDDARTELTKLTLGVELQTDLYATALEFGANNVETSWDQPLSILVIGHGNTESENNISDETTTLKPGDTIVVRVPEVTYDIEQSQ